MHSDEDNHHGMMDHSHHEHPHDQGHESSTGGDAGHIHAENHKQHEGGHSTHAAQSVPGARHAHHSIADFARRFWFSLVLTIPILVLSPTVQMIFGFEGRITFAGASWVVLAFSSLVYFYGGWPFLKGFVDEVRRRLPGMMTLVAIAITVAYVYSVAVTLGLKGMVFFWELATLVDIMLLGHWIEMKFVMRASMALQALAKLLPSEVHLKDPDGTIRDMPIEALNKGDILLIKPGERVPTDGVITEGRTSMNESMLTGESRPVSKIAGDRVIGGAINGDGTVSIQADKVGSDTFLSQVIEMVRRAQESKSRTQDLADHAAFWLTLTATGTGAIALVAWLAIGKDFAYAIERAVTVMVIACPHALGLAIPLVVAVSTALAASHGFIIRNRAAFENARNIDTVVFDKTGTLTLGEFRVQAIVPLADIGESEILKLAASVESASEHPIAKGIIEEANKRQISFPSVKDFQAIKGMGAKGEVDGKAVVLASPGYLDATGIEYDKAAVEKHLGQDRTLVFVIADSRLAGAIALGDSVRNESRAAIESLKKMGIRTILLTGDNRKVAEAVSQALGIDEYHAEVLPDRKAGKIRELMDKGLHVAMTGDGINDAPALATADLGIAIGAGTDVAVETADIVLVRNDPRDVAAVIMLARTTYRKMIQNLIWATGYNVVAIPLAAGVLAGVGVVLSPAVGAILMSASTIVVAINARLLSMKT